MNNLGGILMKRLIYFFIVVSMGIGLCSFPVVASSELSEPAPWAKEAVKYLNNYQLIPDELFYDYNTPIRRDEFAATLMDIYNEACQNYYTFPNEPDKFTDTVSNKYSTVIKKANIMGIINGTSETTFSPDRNITREDIATLIYRFIKLMYPQENSISNKTIADRNQIADYALSSVEFCMNNGIMNGTGNDMFSPKGLLTRQEAMVLMYNICNRYKVVENGRGSAIKELTPCYRGLHEMVYDGYLYIREYGYPFSFNGSIVLNKGHTLIRTPIDQSEKNQGELLFTHADDISVYTVNQEKIFFGDRNLNRGIYSTDKDGKNRKLLYTLSGYLVSDFSFMHVEGDWLFVDMGGMLFKMRTDGTCLSIIYKEDYARTFFAEGENFYISRTPHPAANEGVGEILFSRVSLTGDRTELIYRQEIDVRGYSLALYGNKLYIALSERDGSIGPPSPIPGTQDISPEMPLIEVNLDTKKVTPIGGLSVGESLVKDALGAYIFSINQNTLSWKNISGGNDISVTIAQGVKGNYATKYDNCLYFSVVADSSYTRHYYLYNINTGYYTDIYGNPVN